MKKLYNYFSRAEIVLWCVSVLLIVLSFCIFDRESYLSLIASLIGVTSLIFNAKGNPIGQALMIVFSLPMALFALISWLKNPYNGNKAEVKVNHIGKKEQLLMWFLTVVVTLLFYYILDYFNTANIIPSTLSVTTSFIAVYLTFRRCPAFALAYAANDLILILLWWLASLTEIRYISVVMCFVAFLFNDIYGYINWQRMKKRQD